MNGNRGQYTSAPLNNMKNKRAVQAAQMGHQAPTPPQGAPRFGFLALILSLVLPVLFLLALLIPNQPLRWSFLIVTALAVIFMWILRAFVKNARGTLTVVYAALAVVIGLALFMDYQTPESRNTSSSIQDQGALFTNPDTSALNQLLSSNATPSPTSAVASNAISLAQQQLESFLALWAQGNIPEMLKLCTPNWIAQQQSPEAALYQLIRMSTPLSYVIESVSGSEGDTSRTITMKINIMPISGTGVETNRMHVLMFRINDAWYVDPQSLGGTPIDEAAELAQQNQPIQQSTIAPTATPAPSDGNVMLLYYNSDGGKYYHSKANCSAVAERYWPLDEFYYSDLNSQQFKNLIRCSKCDAPQRPGVN